MPFIVETSDRLSFADLAKLHAAGLSVRRTPHVGNVYPSSLAVAFLGLPILLVDQNLGERDANFHPHLLICGGRSERIADPTRLVSRARVERVPERFAERFARDASLAEAHVRALRDAFPRTPIETVSEYYRTRADLFAPYLEILTAAAPEAWTRYVRPDGRVEEHPGRRDRAWKHLVREGVHGLADSGGGGWLVPNAWNILSDGVEGALASGHAVVYALSGPDMIRYHKQHAAEFDRLYEILRARWNKPLPETLRMIMIPSAEMRLVTVKRRAWALDRLVGAYEQILSLKSEGAKLRDLDAAARTAAIREMETRRKGLVAEFADAARGCPEVFYDIKDAAFLTQYDLLAGETLYVHPWGINAPLGEVRNLLEFAKRQLAP